jgi:hypothetical protein
MVQHRNGLTVLTGPRFLPWGLYAVHLVLLYSYNSLIYVVGESVGSNAVFTVEVFDGTSWTYKKSMDSIRYGLGLAVYQGLLYAVGEVKNKFKVTFYRGSL